MACYFPFIKDNLPLPCGKCPPCLQKRANNWVFRCMQEAKVSDTTLWCTLTYESPPLDANGMMTLRPSDLQKFWKRLRKIKRDFSKKTIKYYGCGEYGSEFERPHYHAVIFNSSPEHVAKAWNDFMSLDDEQGVKLGFTTFDELNHNTAMYTAKYMNKGKLIPKFKGDLRHPEFQVFSKKLGINFITDATKHFYNADPTRSYVSINGFKKSLPRYFYDKLVVCPVFRLAKRMYAQDKAATQYAANVLDYEQSPRITQTFLSFVAERKHHALKNFKENLKKRNKFV